MNSIFKILEYLFKVALITFNQIVSLLGLFFLFGLLLFFISKLTRKVFVNSGYYKLDIYLTGWIGVPVHEIGHAIFCLIFRHKINEMKLFQINSFDGTLGYVNHSYNKNSYYQIIGNFFIGAGPIIFGSFVLYVLMYFLVPNQNQISNLLSANSIQNLSIKNIFANVENLFSIGNMLVKFLFTSSNFTSVYFFIFLYISLCISSHMQLSPPDIKGMLFGLFFIVMILFILNLVTIYLGVNFSNQLYKINSYTILFNGMFVYSLFISLINFVFTYLIMTIIYFVKHKRLLSLF
ncbi:MAG: hypothetical protein N2321_01860 [Melioribacteraceae bacterium]|nr:hypothetical protein [Melioribacteraceae bacterium]